MSIVTPFDKKLEWIFSTMNCSSKVPLKVTVIDTPSIVSGSVRVSTSVFCIRLLVVISGERDGTTLLEEGQTRGRAVLCPAGLRLGGGHRLHRDRGPRAGAAHGPAGADDACK